MNRQTFFDEIRKSLFGNKLNEKQVEGMEALLDECNNQGVDDPRMIAYILATTYHETGKKVNGVFVRTMQPIKEVGEGANMPYGRRIWYNRTQYNDVPHIYYGRGYTQNTWRDNYVSLTKAIRKQGKDFDFEHNPDLLLNVHLSAWATVYAMRTGLYTGRNLASYFTKIDTNPIGARKIINGLDCATKIAEYYDKFFDALT